MFKETFSNIENVKPQSGIFQPKSYLDLSFNIGVVEYSDPVSGLVLVRPSSGNIVGSFICRPSHNGGNWGVTGINLPPAGTQAFFYTVNNTEAYLIGCSPQGKEMSGCTIFTGLHQYPECRPLREYQFHETYLQEIELIARKKYKDIPAGAIQNIFSGDAFITDKNGPGIFVGRGQIAVKGSELSYTEYSSILNKIYSVTQSWGLDTFSDCIQVDTELNKILKAANARESVGLVTDDENDIPFEIKDSDDQINIEYKKNLMPPLYREQELKGGLVGGICHTLVQPIKDKKDVYPVSAFDYQTYDGDQTHVTAGSRRFVKTANIAGFCQKPASDPDFKPERDELPKALKQEMPGEDRALQLSAYLEAKDTGMFIPGFLDLEKLLDQEIQLEDQTLGKLLSWKKQQNETEQKLPGPEKCQYKDPLDKDNEKRKYKALSFITQQENGSIVIRDGWGSEICMSGGNIYISSALDTFIRPGRDLIGLTPRNMEIDANGDMVLAAKKDLKLASEKNAVLSGGNSGKEGHVVVETRSKDKSGLIIRSDGNLTAVAGKDIHFSLNDVSSNELKEGRGRIYIGGGDIIVNAKQNLRLSGRQAGICGNDQTSGSGILLDSGRIALIAPYIGLDSAFIEAGVSQIPQTFNTGSIEQDKQNVVLSAGAGETNLKVHGRFQSKDAAVVGSMNVSETMGAASYLAFSTQGQKEIPGVIGISLNMMKRYFNDLFKQNFSLPAVEFPKPDYWYTAEYIRNHQLTFTATNDLGFSGTYKMPAMCWQLKEGTHNTIVFEPVKTKSTENADKVSCTYPGDEGWKSGVIASVDSDYNVSYNKKLSEAYVTNTKKGAENG